MRVLTSKRLRAQSQQSQEGMRGRRMLGVPVRRETGAVVIEGLKMVQFDAAHRRPLCRDPEVPSSSPVWTVGPAIVPPIYSLTQHRTWRTLCRLQAPLVARYACRQYLAAQESLRIGSDRIPFLRDLDAKLRCLTGWGLVRAPGFVESSSFFWLLSKKLFPCSDLLRHEDEVEFSPEPDMWHDVMGHLPQLADPTFHHFYELFGQLGSRARTQEQVDVLGKVCLFTMEFGLINPSATRTSVGLASESRSYGAALASGLIEVVPTRQDITRQPFSVEAVAEMENIVYAIKDVLFEVPSFESLYSTLVEWSGQQRLL